MGEYIRTEKIDTLNSVSKTQGGLEGWEVCVWVLILLFVLYMFLRLKVAISASPKRKISGSNMEGRSYSKVSSHRHLRNNARRRRR